MSCVNSSVPSRRGERFGFWGASTLDVQEARHDLRKFITEFPVAEGGVVLSSGREHPGPTVLVPGSPGPIDRLVPPITRPADHRSTSVRTPGARRFCFLSLSFDSDCTAWRDDNRKVATGNTERWSANRKADRQIDSVGRLTPGAGIEISTQMGSDQKAAEALQEAETEVGVAVKVDRSVRPAELLRALDPGTTLALQPAS